MMRRPVFRTCSNSLRATETRRFVSAYGYTQAKSLVIQDYGNPSDVLSLHTHSISPPNGNLVTLRTLAAPLNPADINQIQGVYPAKPKFDTSLGTTQPSAVPGNEAVFEVQAAGSGADGLKKGDWVICRQTGLGTWRTHLQIESSKLLKINKEGLTPLQAATVGVNPITAWRMLTDFVGLDAHRGDWFIQNGSNSGVGRAALQLGKRWGWNSIAMVRGGRPEKEMNALREELHSLGATKVVTEEEAQEKGFGQQVKEWTNGGREQVRLSLNCVGGKSATAMSKILANGAHMVTYGAMSKQPMTIPAGFLIFKNISFDGFWVSRWSEQNPEEKEKCVKEVLDLTREGKFKDTPMVPLKWEWGTKQEELVEAVQGTLGGFRAGKGIFVFGET